MTCPNRHNYTVQGILQILDGNLMFTVIEIFNEDRFPARLRCALCDISRARVKRNVILFANVYVVISKAQN